MTERLSGILSGFLVAFMFAAALWAIDALPRGLALPGKVELPAHARRALFVCVLFVEAVAEMAIVFHAMRAAGS